MTWCLAIAIMAASDALVTEAKAREVAQDDPGAIALWQGEAERDPQAVLPHIELGRLLLKSGQALDAAGEHLERARALAPNNPRVHYLLGLLAEERQDPPTARRFLETALELRDDYDEARYRLAGLLLSEGDTDGAVRAYRRYLEGHPDDSAARLQLALALDRGGKRREAERVLRRLVKDGNNPLARRRLAELLEQDGRRGEAAKLRAEAPARRLRPLRPSSR